MKRLYKTSGFLLLAVAVLANVLSSCSSSRRSIPVEEGWELIGEEKVNFVRDKDEVIVTSRNQFTDIRFRVEEREVRIQDLKIYFENGDKLEPSIDLVVFANRDSRNIELAQDGRIISKIEFTYRTTGNLLKGRANVLIYGKRHTLGF
ncbi:MAG TPA: hypothetical protein VEY06_12795 [Flavisolibacter sp.]|nr:hypothetical protein [Flavisolibacter sp.]